MGKNIFFLITLLSFSLVTAQIEDERSISIQEQGSFAVGGTVKTNPGTFHTIQRTPEGQTYHGDHAYVFYQKPMQAKQYPLVMWHGIGQFSKTWETTPDGREGFQNLFLRRNYSVYVLDQPRRGNASRSMQEAHVVPTPDEQFWFNTFRVGEWPNYFPGVQFASDSETLNQYFRQMVPNMGSIDYEVNVNAVSALFDTIGKGILVTHSHSGGMGWLTAIDNPNIKAIVSYEPGSGFVFPENEMPASMESAAGVLEATPVAMDDFLKLTKIPIVIYYGDNIPVKPSTNPGVDGWRIRLAMARKWRDVVNAHGGDVTVVHLPEIGITGNTHFPFSDLNNKEIADIMEKWLKEKGLDKRDSIIMENSTEDIRKELGELSKQKWEWMATKNVNQLADLFDSKAKFVHMGGTWGTEQELDIIKSGGIWYKKADVHETNVELFGNDMAIVWNQITLLAEVGGNEVSNPFMVTEVYTNDKGAWKLVNLTFSKLIMRD